MTGLLWQLEIPSFPQMALRMFTLMTWSQKASILSASSASNASSNLGASFGLFDDRFGISLELSSDGSTVAVGAENAETTTATDAGKVYIQMGRS